MDEPYLKVPVSELIDYAKCGIAYFDAKHNEKWEKRVAEELAKKPRTGWPWGRRLVTREEIEAYFGKPEKGEKPDWNSVWYNIYGETKQYQDYQNFVQLHKLAPNKEITLTVRSYNALMTFGE